MTRTWTTVGDEAMESRLEGGLILTRSVVEIAIDALPWQPAPGPEGVTLPIMVGMALERAIGELRIPRVSRFAVSNDLAPYAFLGIEGNYTNGRAQVFVLDRGSDLLPLASDFYEKEA